MKVQNEKATFREVNGLWQRVDSQEPNPLVLADYLENLGILIDDQAQFCKIIRYYVHNKQTIVYRHNGSKITIEIFYNE